MEKIMNKSMKKTMKRSMKKICVATVIGSILVGSIPVYQGLAAKGLKVNKKSFTIMVGKTASLTANLKVTFKSSNKKIVSISKVKNTKCTLVAKKKGNCIITVKAKNKKAITVKVTVKEKKVTTPKTTATPKPKKTEAPTKTPKNTPNVTEQPIVTPEAPTSSAVLETPVPTEDVVVPTQSILPEATKEVVVTTTPYAPSITGPVNTLTPEEIEKLQNASVEPMPTIQVTNTPEVTSTMETTKEPVQTSVIEQSAIPEVTPTMQATQAPSSTSSCIPSETPVLEETNTPEPTETPVATSGSSITAEDTDTLGGKVNNLGYNLSKLMDQEENRVISSFSIITALSMLDKAADGDTKAEIEKMLGITDFDGWNKELSEHLIKNCGDQITDIVESKENLNKYGDERFGAQLCASNSLWYNKKMGFDSAIQKEYMAELDKEYKAECKELNFAQADRNPKDDINEWVEEKTNHKIKDLLKDKLDENETKLILINTLYFNGCWSTPFEELGTKKEVFYGTNGETKVDIMHQTKEFSYYETDGLMGVELPFYREDGIVMDIITSKDKEVDGVALYEKMSNAQKNKFMENLGNAVHQEVKLHLPKFKLEYGTKSLKEYLKNLGMKNAFDQVKASLPAIKGDSMYNAYVDDVLHKAIVEVKESGATAAAATAVISNEAACLPEEPKKPKEFDANHPFVFVIRDNNTNTIYFMGQIKNLE